MAHLSLSRDADRRRALAWQLTQRSLAVYRGDLTNARSQLIGATLKAATLLAIRAVGEDDGTQPWRARYLAAYHRRLRELRVLPDDQLLDHLYHLSSPSAALPAEEGATPASPGVTASSADRVSTVSADSRHCEKPVLGGA